MELFSCWSGEPARSRKYPDPKKEFWRRIDEDVDGWQLRALADECRRREKSLGDGQCYAFTTMPAFGGSYTPDNVWIAPWDNWFSFTAYVFEQIKDLPDGAKVSFKIVD